MLQHRLTAPVALAALTAMFTVPANEITPWNAHNALVWALFTAGVFVVTLAAETVYRLIKMKGGISSQNPQYPQKLPY